MRIDEIRKILVLGAGRMGTEIALQCAIGGFDVFLQDLSPEQLAKSAEWRRTHLEGFVREARLTRTEADAIERRVTATTDTSVASQADLVTESVPENLKLKREIFTKLHALCPPHTVFTTNTSYLRPSQIAAHVGRPQQFAALHFHPPVWYSNVVDVMPHEGTSPETVELLRQFAGRIGQIPIICRQEGEGYIFNTILRTWLLTAITLADNGSGSIEDIDRSWMGVMVSKIGPFGILDNIGLDTVSDILNFWGLILRDQNARRASAFLKPYVQAGRLGVKTGQGFYTYPNPVYLQDGFLAGAMTESTAGDSLIQRFMKHSRNGAAPVEKTATSKRLPEAAPPGQSVTAPADNDAPQRYVVRTQPTVVHQKLKHPLRFHGPCLVVGDNPDGAALRAKLESLGATVVTLNLEGTLDEILARHSELWTKQSLPHLFLLTARDPDAVTQNEAAWWARRSERGVLLPFFICQKWYAEVMQRGIFETATVVGATALGGDFGVGGRIEAVEGGGIAGLLKTVYLEGAVRSSLGPQVKVVDAPLSQISEATAEQLCREMALAQASVVTGSRDEARRRYIETEVGYCRGVRHQVYAERAPLDSTPIVASPRRASIDSSEWAVPPGSTWVVTGGARGITEYVAREMARRFHLRMHLLGTTRLPQRDLSQASPDELAGLEQSTRAEAVAAGKDPESAWSRISKGIDIQRTLAEWSREGLHAAYHACDVSDRTQLAEILAQIRQQDGPIAGVLHGAGLEVGAKLPEKNPDIVRATLAVKATGMAHLMDLTRDDPLQWFIAFGSLSGRFGNFAQADYAMANELLAKQLVWFRAQRPECRGVVFHWPGWSDVGMAARPEGKEGLQRGHHTFLAPEAGIEHLMQELVQESPAAEVVIVHRNEVPLEMRLEPAATGKRAPTWQK